MGLNSDQNKRNRGFEIDVDASAGIAREKKAFNLIYGGLAGLTFALALWGMDAIRLSQAHALFPWLKLALGVAICSFIGVALGWLVARVEHGLVSIAAWIATAAAFSWLAIGLQLQIVPVAAKILDPGLDRLLKYGIANGELTKFWVALVLCLIFFPMMGILQNALVEAAVFAMAPLARLAPFVLCAILSLIAGSMLDDLANAPFRDAILGVDTPIQFILQHQGREVDAAEARRVHAGALNSVRDFVTSDYRLIVGAHDYISDVITVLVRFGSAWVTCSTAYGQAMHCELIDSG